MAAATADLGDVSVHTAAASKRVYQALCRDEYVALVGPTGSGKTTLLLDLLCHLQADETRLGVYFDLASRHIYRLDELLPALVAQILQTISVAGSLHLPLNGDDVRDGQDFRHFLRHLLGAVPNTFVVVLDHVETLPHYLTKGLLRCFRVVYTEREVHPDYRRFVVLAAGELNLFELTTSLVSPFNVATLVSIPDADPEQARDLIRQIAARAGVGFTPAAAEKVLAAAGGDAHLIRHICRTAIGRGSAHGRVTAPEVNRVLVDLEAGDPACSPCLGQTIRLIEAKPDILKTVLDVLAGREVKRRELHTEVDSVELTGAIKVIAHRYALRSPLCGRVLSRYFTPRRVARLFSAFGRWDEAIGYFEQSGPASDPAVRVEYLAAVVNRIYGDQDEGWAFEAVATALVKGFGVRQLLVYGHSDQEGALLPAASRGVSQDQPRQPLRLRDMGARPEVRAWDSGDYLLEKNEAGESLLILPVVSGGASPPVGVVVLFEHFPIEEYHNRRDHVVEMAAFLAQVGRAIGSQRERQRLLRREQQQVQALGALSRVTKGITSVREQERLLKQVVQAAKEVLEAHVVTLYLYDANEKRFFSPLGVGLKHEHEFYTMALPDPQGQFAGWVVRTRRWLVFSDAAGHPAAERVPFVRSEGICSIGGFPMLRGREPLGVLFVGYRVPHQFLEAECQIILAFADHSAIAIENARLYHRLNLDNTRLANLYQVSTRLASLDLEEVLDAITGSLQSMYDLTTCTVGLLDEAESRLDFVAYRGLLKPTTRLIADLPPDRWHRLRGGERQFLPDVGGHPEVTMLLERPDLGSFAALPLQGGEGFLGILTMGRKERLDLQASDWELITALADQAAVAIENAQLHGKVRQANKALEDSLKVLTHQLRSEPAFVTDTLSTVLAGKVGPLNAQQQDRLARAQQRLEQHHRLINSLNLYGRLKGGKVIPRKKTVQMARLIQDLVRDYKGRAREAGLRLETRLNRVPSCQVDDGLVAVVITNLLDNAIRFTPAGGSICLSTWADLAGVHIAIDDTGPGIPLEDREKVFDEYFQVHRAHGETGVGLGLYIARRLVDINGGSIAVVDKEGPGARLEVVLPV